MNPRGKNYTRRFSSVLVYIKAFLLNETCGGASAMENSPKLNRVEFTILIKCQYYLFT